MSIPLICQRSRQSKYSAQGLLEHSRGSLPLIYHRSEIHLGTDRWSCLLGRFASSFILTVGKECAETKSMGTLMQDGWRRKVPIMQTLNYSWLKPDGRGGCGQQQSSWRAIRKKVLSRNWRKSVKNSRHRKSRTSPQFQLRSSFLHQATTGHAQFLDL